MRQTRRQHPESVPVGVARSDPKDPTSELFPSGRTDSLTARLPDRFRSTEEFVVPAKNADRACIPFVSSKPPGARSNLPCRQVRQRTFQIAPSPSTSGRICRRRGVTFIVCHPEGPPLNYPSASHSHGRLPTPERVLRAIPASGQAVCSMLRKSGLPRSVRKPQRRLPHWVFRDSRMQRGD